MQLKSIDAQWRKKLWDRLEDAYDWVGEWVGDVSDTRLALIAFALVSVSVFYVLMH